MPARWWRRWPAGSMRARTAGAGWCASRMSTRRAACRARTAQILQQLAACGLCRRAPVLAVEPRRRLPERAATACARAAGPTPAAARGSDIEPRWRRSGAARERHGERSIPAPAASGLHGKPARAVRLLAARRAQRPMAALTIDWLDRRLGAQCAGRERTRSATSCSSAPTACGPISWRWWSTTPRKASRTSCAARTWPTTRARQILLQRALGLPTPSYLHTPLVLGADGEKLSKQNGAQALDLPRPAGARCARPAAVLGCRRSTPATLGDTPGSGALNAVARALGGMMRGPQFNLKPRIAS